MSHCRRRRRLRMSNVIDFSTFQFISIFKALLSTKKILLWREIVWPRRCFAVDLKARSHGPRKTQ